MTRWVSEESIAFESGEHLRIKRRSTTVAVTWYCGDEAVFRSGKLPEVIAYIEMFPSDIWVRQESSGGTHFETRLDGDRLFVRPNGGSEEVVDSWTDLKAALLDASAASDQKGA